MTQLISLCLQMTLEPFIFEFNKTTGLNLILTFGIQNENQLKKKGNLCKKERQLNNNTEIPNFLSFKI